jgi:hypothetical protein
VRFPNKKDYSRKMKYTESDLQQAVFAVYTKVSSPESLEELMDPEFFKLHKVRLVRQAIEYIFVWNLHLDVETVCEPLRAAMQDLQKEGKFNFNK